VPARASRADLDAFRGAVDRRHEVEIHRRDRHQLPASDRPNGSIERRRLPARGI
jgi:hypothetical protein